MTQPQDVTLCSTIDGTRKTIFFLFLPHQNENIVIEFVTERMGGRRKKNRLSSSSRLDKMRIPFLFGFQVTAKLLPVPIVHVAHELNRNVTQDDHDHRAFYPQTRFSHPYFFFFVIESVISSSVYCFDSSWHPVIFECGRERKVLCFDLRSFLFSFLKFTYGWYFYEKRFS